MIVLLAGNGFNRLGNNASFDRLIDRLMERFGAVNKGEPGDKPFPLLFEEIFASSKNINPGNMPVDREMLEAVAELARDIKPNAAHIMTFGWGALEDWGRYDTILTTNYDANLQWGLEHKEQHKPGEYPDRWEGRKEKKWKWKRHTRETRYSLYRKLTVNAREEDDRANAKKYAKAFNPEKFTHTIWHIHGEAEKPLSICLGYEQYAGYVQQIREYVTKGTPESGGSIKQRLAALAKKPSEDDAFEAISWVDHFFFSNMTILGLEMDTQEIDLWWILSYRARLIKQGGAAAPKNKIRYYYWEGETLNSRQQAARELLRSFSVILTPISLEKAPTWGDFYVIVMYTADPNFEERKLDIPNNFEELQGIDRSAVPELVRIEPGKYLFYHPYIYIMEVEITITRAFLLGSCEVTQGEYEAVMGENPCFITGENLPVETVSWFDALLYCNKRSEREGLTPVYAIDRKQNTDQAQWLVTWDRNANGYRLPTLAEWLYAISEEGVMVNQNRLTGSAAQANINYYDYSKEKDHNYRGRTTPVGSFPPNPRGLYDMQGNVKEWCWDTDWGYWEVQKQYWKDHNDQNRAATDPAGPVKELIYGRYPGNCVCGSCYQDTSYGTTSNVNVETRSKLIGFRLARNAD